jgi:hypothetical protein
MAAFGIITIPNEIVDKFMEDTNERLEGDNFVKNPFYGKIKLIDDSNTCAWWAIVMRPVYAPYYWFGLLGATGILFIAQGWTNWAILPLLLFASGIFYNGWFFAFMLRIGLRKAGYTGVLKILGKEEVINRLIN